jgi:flagellar biosynthesis protein FlhF
MQIKRFEAKDVQGALRQVKEALGEEAIILSTRKIKKPSASPGAFDGARVEVIAATDQPANPPTFFPVQFAATDRRKERPKSEEGFSEDPFTQRILSIGLVPEFVNNLLRGVRGLQKKQGYVRFPDSYRDWLRTQLMEAVEVSAPYLQGAKIWAFIGPTGVGKTTTLAKLAAHFHLRMTKRITLITIDTYRIGAIEQLKTYARILGLPLEVAASGGELKEIIGKNRDQDLLLIDTAGRNPHDPAVMEELKEYLTVHPAIENHLVLSATMKDRDLAQMVYRFSALPIKSYIITKIDETEEFVPIFNQLWRYKKPLSYLTNGQRVPEDIELATKGRIANLILNQIPWS